MTTHHARIPIAVRTLQLRARWLIDRKSGPSAIYSMTRKSTISANQDVTLPRVEWLLRRAA